MSRDRHEITWTKLLSKVGWSFVLNWTKVEANKIMGPQRNGARSSLNFSASVLGIIDSGRPPFQWLPAHGWPVGAVRGVVNVAEGQNNSRPQLSVHSAPWHCGTLSNKKAQVQVLTRLRYQMNVIRTHIAGIFVSWCSVTKSHNNLLIYSYGE